MDRLRAALAVLVALGVLVACEDDPEPRVDDPTPSVSSEPTESATASTSPAELDPEGTIRAWVDAWNLAYATGDTAKVRSYEADGCQGCDEVIGPLEQALAAGGRFEGGEWSIISVKVVNQTAGDAQVALAVDVAEGSAVPSADATPSPFPASKHLLNFRLANQDAQWRVTDIEVLS